MERLSQIYSLNTAIGTNSVATNKQSDDASSHSNATNKKQPYISHQPDSHGHIHYSDDEHAMWQALLARQAEQTPNRACTAYLEGLTKLNLPTTHIPQLHDIDEVLQATTGWQTAAVPALISFGKFFLNYWPISPFLWRRLFVDLMTWTILKSLIFFMKSLGIVRY